MKDKFLGIEVSQVNACNHSASEDGLYVVKREDFKSKFARKVLGKNYGGKEGTSLRALFREDIGFETPVRGKTGYLVQGGEVVDRIDLPLIIRKGKMDHRVTIIKNQPKRITMTSERNVGSGKISS